jgi:hypothetical protein
MRAASGENMKSFTFLLLAIWAALVLFGAGCRKEAQVGATRQLQQSFQTAEPETQKAMETVNTSLKAGNYEEAARVLAPVVSQRVLTDAQKQAVGAALQQINKSIAANPKLDTKEMYELRAKMFQAVHGTARF